MCKTESAKSGRGRTTTTKNKDEGVEAAVQSETMDGDIWTTTTKTVDVEDS